MTAGQLVTGPPDTTLDRAEQILKHAKVEKLLLVHDDFTLAGLITMRDIERAREYGHSCKDGRGRLRVGAAVGPQDFDRVEQLIQSGVDVVVVDTAHGHSTNVLQTVQAIRKRYDIDLIAGNVGTREGAAELIDAGADAIKVGIGPGSICTTRVISGVGMPQITAIMNAVAAAADTGVPVIADGGIRHSGDVTKAIAAGAGAVMIGSLFAGLKESPGNLVLWRGRQYKEYRGMGYIAAMSQGSSDRYFQELELSESKLVPEGVEARIPYRGALSFTVHQMLGGLRAGMGYCGTKNIEALRTQSKFIRITPSGLRESHVHDVIVTKEAPNYRIDS